MVIAHRNLCSLKISYKTTNIRCQLCFGVRKRTTISALSADLGNQGALIHTVQISKQLLEVQGCQFYPKTEFSGEKPSYRHMVYLVFPPQDGWDCFHSVSDPGQFLIFFCLHFPLCLCSVRGFFRQKNHTGPLNILGLHWSQCGQFSHLFFGNDILHCPVWLI